MTVSFPLLEEFQRYNLAPVARQFDPRESRTRLDFAKEVEVPCIFRRSRVSTHSTSIDSSLPFQYLVNLHKGNKLTIKKIVIVLINQFFKTLITFLLNIILSFFIFLFSVNHFAKKKIEKSTFLSRWNEFVSF